MTLLLTGSSNSEKLRGLFSISVSFLLHPFLTCLFLPSFDVLPSEYAESKPSALNDSTDPAVLHASTDTYLLGLLLSMLISLPPHICKQRATARLPVHPRLRFKEFKKN